MMMESMLVWSQYLVLFIMIMISVAFFSLLERKVLSLIHFRVGPNKVAVMGLLQPIVDALKLVTKDDYPVFWSNYLLYYLSPLLMFTISLSTWVMFPLLTGVNLKYSVIVLMIFLGMSVYGILISGWSSNSKYALIGSMRSVSQSLSYEVVMSFLILTTVVVMASYSLLKFQDMSLTMISLMFFPSTILFTIAVLAELNRAPFDLSEGESELVSGYSVEYGGIMYTLLFLSENISIFTSSFLISYLFGMKYYTITLMMTWVFVSMVICVIRGIVPRMRYDYLMMVCWTLLLPVTLVSMSMISLMTVLA